MLESISLKTNLAEPSLLRKIADHPTTVGSVLKTATLIGLVGSGIYLIWTRPAQALEDQETALWQKMSAYLWNYGIQTLSGLYVAYNRRWYNNTVSKLEHTSASVYESIRSKLTRFFPSLNKSESDLDLRAKEDLFNLLSDAVESFDEAPVAELIIKDARVSISQQELKAFFEFVKKREQETLDPTESPQFQTMKL